MPVDWNATLFEASHAYVWEMAKDLVDLLAPKPGERILDVGCGTGRLTSEISRSGASVLGVDNSPAMVAQARETVLRSSDLDPHRGSRDLWAPRRLA